MKPNLHLIGAVLFLAAGLGVIFSYSQGTSSMNIGYPLAASALQIATTTTGPAVLGGVCLTVVGLVLLAWALICAIVGEVSFSASGLSSQARAERAERAAERAADRAERAERLERQPNHPHWFERSK